RPEVPEYHLLMDQLARYQRIVREGGWQPVRGEIPTDIGQSGAGVVELRNRLIKEGDAEEVRLAQYGAAAPPVYDDSLAAAVEHFQVRHALQPDGRVGASTLEQLNTSAEERVQQIVLNLDQWRWLPQNLGDSYILVNVAGFELEYIRDDTVALAMNVVVGQEGWETAIFADTMEHIVVNPYWHVPPSIRNDEVIPDRADPRPVALDATGPRRQLHPRERRRLRAGVHPRRHRRAGDERRGRAGRLGDCDLRRHDGAHRREPVLERSALDPQRRGDPGDPARSGLPLAQQHGGSGGQQCSAGELDRFRQPRGVQLPAEAGLTQRA